MRPSPCQQPRLILCFLSILRPFVSGASKARHRQGLAPQTKGSKDSQETNDGFVWRSVEMHSSMIRLFREA